MQNPLPEYERCLQNYSMSFLCQNKGLHKSLHAKFGFIWKIWTYITFSFVSHGSSPRPTLEASVSLAKVPDFLAELLPTGAFYPQAVLLLPGASPPPHTHTHTHTHPPTHRHTPTTSLFHINSSLSKCRCPLPSLHGPARLWRSNRHQWFT